MHELSLMTEAVRMAVEAAKRAGRDRVLLLRMRVGALSGAVPEALRFAFDAASSGTIAEGATLEINPVPAVCWCEICRAEFEGADFMAECPRCHTPGGEWRRGRELELAE